MAVSSYEVHPFSGRPVYLYEFLRTSNGTDYYWRYNNSDRDLWYNLTPWKAVPISHDGIRISPEAASTDLTLTMPIAEAFCDQFRLSGATPSDTVWLRVRRVHASDIEDLDGETPTVQGDALVEWIGTVNGIAQIGELEAQVGCSMLSASFRRGGLRYGYQQNCPHVLYAPHTCKVDKELFRVSGEVTDIDKLTVSVEEFAAQPAGWFAGGFIEYFLPSGILERRMVLSHTGSAVGLVGIPVGMLVGDTISAFPGCNLTVDTCLAKFNNLDNMGGFPHTPGRNPFDGNPVF
jgi:uncharacterized phage protein (TIGR02218 family)